MSSILRRMRRKNERNKKKGIDKPMENLYIPTKSEVEEYILNKSKELRNQDPFDNMDEFFTKNK